MDEKTRTDVVAYFHVVTKRRITTVKEVTEHEAFVLQWKLVGYFLNHSTIKLKKKFVGVHQSLVSKPLRGSFKEAVHYASSNDLPLLVADWSRVTRDPAIYAELEALGVPVISVRDGGKINGLNVNIQFVEAHLERQLRSRRAKKGAELNKGSGYLGNWRNIDEARKKALESKARKANEFALKIRPTINTAIGLLPEDKKRSPSAIANCLNDLGVTTRNKKEWRPSGVKSLLERIERLDRGKDE